jgi:hypothetical protein
MTLLKILWALNSAGSVDMVLFYNFGKGVEQYGLTSLYGMDEKFNHTPLTGGFAWLLYRFAGDDKLQFAFLLRLPSIIADAAVVARSCAGAQGSATSRHGGHLSFSRRVQCR